MKLSHLILAATALLLLGGYDPVLSTSSGNLRTFVGCAAREFTFLAKKPGCRGLRITTDACWGRCETWEKPILEPPYIEAYHRVCTYNETKQVTVKLPHCAPGVDPFYTYPVAVRCDCGRVPLPPPSVRPSEAGVVFRSQLVAWASQIHPSHEYICSIPCV